MSVRALSRSEALAIHAAAIARFGGLDGVRDEGMPDSALAQPFQTAFGEELYPGLARKAARYAYGIARDHPFADGNKRTAAACMGAFTRLNGARFKPRAAELLEVMLGVADGSVGYEALASWVERQG